MYFKFSLWALFLAASAGPILVAQDAHSIVHAHAQAIGGKKAIQAVETLVRKGMVDVGGGQTIPVHFIQKRPRMSRQEIEFQGQKIVQAYDGKTAWQVNPLTGTSEPTPVPEAQADLMKRQAYLDDILWENQQVRKVSLTYKGTVNQDGRDYHQVGVTFGDGFQQTRLYDVATHLLYQITQKTFDQTGAMVDATTTFSDWRQVGAVKYPYKIVNSLGQAVIFTTTEINSPVADGIFTQPKTTP